MKAQVDSIDASINALNAQIKEMKRQIEQLAAQIEKLSEMKRELDALQDKLEEQKQKRAAALVAVQENGTLANTLTVVSSDREKAARLLEAVRARQSQEAMSALLNPDWSKSSRSLSWGSAEAPRLEFSIGTSRHCLAATPVCGGQLYALRKP